MAAKNKKRKAKANTKPENEMLDGIHPRHILDVKVRTRRGDRLRNTEHIRGAIKIALIGIGLIVAFAVGREVWHDTLYESGEYSLTDLTAESPGGKMTRRAILRHANVHEEMNLLRVDIEQVRENLVALPQVAAARVERHLPNKLNIVITERNPIAWLSCPELLIEPRTSKKGILLDDEGVALRCDSVLREYLAFPVVEVDQIERILPGKQMEDEGVRMAIDLIGYNARELFKYDLNIKKIKINTDYSMRVSYSNDMTVLFGKKDLERQKRNLRLILDDAAQKNRQIATLNLLPKRNIPVTYYNYSNESEDLLSPEPVEAPVEVMEPAAPVDVVPDHRDKIRSILGA